MALTGFHLKVAANYWVPWMEFSGHFENPHGFAWEIFHTFARKFNFTYTLVQSIDGTWGNRFKNGTVTGMVGMVNRKETDMALGPFDRTYSRSLVVDYSEALYFDVFTILLPRPKLEEDQGSFLKPFSLEVWCAIFVAILFSSGLGMALENSSFVQKVISESSSGSSNSARKGVFFRAFWIIGTLTSDIVSTQPATDSGKIFLGTWFLASLFLSTAFSAILTSILAVPKVFIPVDSLKDLVEYGKYPWAVSHGSAMVGHIYSEANKQNSLLQIFGEKMIYVSRCDRDKRKVVDEGIAIICLKMSIEMIMNEEFKENGTCSYYMAKEQILTSSLSFVFQKGSPLKRFFDQWILSLRESGIIDHDVRDLTRSAKTCLQKPGTSQNNQLVVMGIKQLSGMFLMLVCGEALGFLVLILEWIFFWAKKI